MPIKNPDLPGVEGPGVSHLRIKAIDKAADKYVEVRDARMKLTEKEVAAKAVLLAAMHDAGVTQYRYDDMLVVISSGKENVRVRHVEDDGEVAEEEDEA